MKKHYVMLNSFQYLLTTILGGAFLCIVFASCNNFLKADEVKKEITKAIEYNNAASYTIRVEAARGSGTILIPAGLEVTKKVTDTFTVKFEPDEAYKFVQWTATVPDLAEGDSASNYIKFEDATSLETTVTFTKAHPGIVITPDCPAIPTATITLEGGHGTFSPTTGEHTIRQWVPLSISYDPLDEYAFVRWRIYDLNTEEEIENGRYITITDPKSRKTECELTNPLPQEGNIKLCIEAVSDKRPRIVSAIPQWTDDGVRKDSRIQIMFDKPMSPKSIYYDEEAGEIERLGQVDDLLRDSQSHCYGYVKNNKHYFKNIQIQDYSSDFSIADRFKAPYFETSKTLVIPVDDTNLPDTGTTIIVSLSEEFFLEREDTSMNDLPVTIKESYIWQYLVNKETDREAPVFLDSDIVIENTAGTSFNTNATSPTKIVNRTLLMKLYATDTKSQPTSNFVLYIQNEAGTYKKSVNIPASVYMKKASFEEDKDPDNPLAKVFYLPYDVALSDGKYRFLITCTDTSGNIATYPEQVDDEQNPVKVKIEDLDDLSDLNTLWFEVDNKGPEIKNLTFKYDENPLTISMQFDDAEYDDLFELQVQCKAVSSPSSTFIKTVQKDQLSYDSTTGTYTYALDDAEYGKTYNITIKTLDDVNNYKEYIYNNITTKPNPPTNVKVKIIRDNGGNGKSGTQDKVVFTWTRPAGNYSGIVVKVKSKGYSSTDWSSVSTCDSYSDNGYTYGVSSFESTIRLSYSTQYQFEVYSYYTYTSNLSNAGVAAVNNGIDIIYDYQTTSISASDLSSLGPTTIASKPLPIVSLSKERADNKITISNLMPSGTNNRSGTVISYKKKYATGNTNWTKLSPSTATQVDISGLQAATDYDIKVEPYYLNPKNTGQPYLLEEYTSITLSGTPVVAFSPSKYLENGNQIPSVAVNISWTGVTNISGYYVNIKEVFSDNSTSYVVNHSIVPSTVYTYNKLKCLKYYKFEVGVYVNTSTGNVFLDPISTGTMQTPPEPCSIDRIVRNGAKLIVEWKLPTDETTIGRIKTNGNPTFSLGYGTTANVTFGSGNTYSLRLDSNNNPVPLEINIDDFGQSMMGQICYFGIRLSLSSPSVSVKSEAVSYTIPQIVLPVTFNEVKDWDKSDSSIRFSWKNPQSWNSLKVYDSAPVSSNLLTTIYPQTPETDEITINGLSRNTPYNLCIVTYYDGNHSDTAYCSATTDNCYRDMNESLSYSVKNSKGQFTLGWYMPENTNYYRIWYVDISEDSPVKYYVDYAGGQYEAWRDVAFLNGSSAPLSYTNVSINILPYNQSNNQTKPLIAGHTYVLKIERCSNNGNNPYIQTTNTIKFSYRSDNTIAEDRDF